MTGRHRHPLLLLASIHGRQAWRRLQSAGRQSRLLSLVVLLFVSGYACVSFWLFYRGLRFVDNFPGLGSLLTERLIYLLFAFLFVLLLFSNLIISYTNFFRNKETHFLLALPIPTVTVFHWKFLESILLASWAFLFLVAPLLVAYGLTREVSWHFYLITSLLLAAFIVLPGVIGASLAVWLARSMDRRTFQITLLAAGLLGIASAGFWFQPETITDTMLETRVLNVLDRMLVKTQFAQFPFLPSYWLSNSVLHWAEGALATAGFFALVLLSNVLFFGSLACLGLGPAFYDGFSKVQSRSHVFGRWAWFRTWQARRAEFAYVPGLAERCVSWLPWLPPDLRAVMVKDIRIFWRDTAQWGQTLVLFGLLGVYIINLRHFSHQLTNTFWINLVSYLNLGACALNLATLTTRFVYPQFSLEGKRIWIIGLAPLGLPRIVQTKFALSTLASLTVTVALIFLSCSMLNLPLDRTLHFVFAIAVMTFALNGLAMGLGTLYPNFKEENPSKIVSGFGGTVCLVLSFIYIVSSVILLASGSPWSKGGSQNMTWTMISWITFATLSVLLGWIPLRLGLRQVTPSVTARQLTIP